MATNFLSKLRNGGVIRLIRKGSSFIRNLLFSIEPAWYRITIVFALIATVVVLSVPETAYPFIYIRSVLGFVFLLYLPGYALIRALFPLKLPIETNSGEVDKIERVLLSIGLSIVLSYIAGLILNYTPWGLGSGAVTLGMLALTIVLATIGKFRQRQPNQLPLH